MPTLYEGYEKLSANKNLPYCILGATYKADPWLRLQSIWDMVADSNMNLMIRPLSEMENRHKINVSTADALQMVPFEEPATSPHDIMARRLKNRERQRRYRARKRHEADLKKACAVNLLSSSHPQVLTEVNAAIAISNDIVTCIHCRRDWKKDVRRAHIFKEQVTPITNLTRASGSQIPSLTFGLDVSSQLLTEFHYPRGSLILDKTETHSSAPSCRNWKAEARNKKD